jgi:hypothetical protein
MNPTQSATQYQPRLEYRFARHDYPALCRKNHENLYQLGYDAGVLAAVHWPNVMSTERFKYMNIADYRDATAEDCIKTLSAPEYAPAFAQGFLVGFEDEAYERGEAGIAAFVDVFVGGSVSESVDVIARRLQRLVVDAGLLATR